MSADDLLLRLRSQDSLNLMLVQANDLRYPVYGLTASTPTSLGGTRTRVILSGRAPVAKDDPYPYQGQTPLEYNRIDIQEYCNGLLDDFRPELPISTYDLLDQISQLTGIEFEIQDIVNETITRSMSVQYTIRAKQESLRWVGQITVQLSDLEDLSTLLGDVGTLTFDSTESPFVDLNHATPFTNVTPFFVRDGERLIDGLVINQMVQHMQAPQRALVEQLFGFQHARGHAVVTDPEPAPYNLYNARLLSVDDPDETVYPNRLNPALNRLMVLELDPAWCTNVTQTRVYLRYTLLENVELAINPMARVFNTGGLSPLDGTAYRTFLATLSAGTIITATPQMALEPNSLDWHADQVRSPTNLYRAVVQYNGPRRTQDNTSIYSQLSHVLVVSINEQWNTHWRGNLHIYYQGD